jgi:hypothetical protein
MRQQRAVIIKAGCVQYGVVTQLTESIDAKAAWSKDAP